MNTLSIRETFALGFMAFALFLGAGNIIFPPFIGLQAGSNVWTAAAGFLVTGVGLPVISVIALAKAGGEMGNIISPVGKTAGNILIVACYLFIGPLFASPRTATVSYELGMAAFTGQTGSSLYYYSFVYFTIATLVSLYPGRLLESVGQILAPLKILSLIVLGGAVFMLPSIPLPAPAEGYADAPLSSGIVNGYLTMDTLAGLAFGLVVVNAVRTRGMTSQACVTRYTIMAGIIAGVGLTLVYLSLFMLGIKSTGLAPGAANGADVLRAFVQYVFGNRGTLFLGVLITLACLVTAIGLTCSCATYFSTVTPFGYRTLVLFFAALSFVISCAGLDAIIRVSIPVLIAVYPPFIMLIIMSFIRHRLSQPVHVIAPATAVAFICGLFDALGTAGLDRFVPALYTALPLHSQQLAWLLPACLTLLLSFSVSRFSRVARAAS
ncbi:branched-chain amino acid transport system II carrier protein [Klebsiella pneumoniae]|uniref:branched-chain amino acid transport system II carrier protein n=1 Tax=Klebsiella pneumoniae TaxID=573 RepID=UPI001083BEA6|nr:branched-chain amino acid transport system II carrier protein [Klebsiella pneumoniae]VFZ29101.1 branched-chain amino acid transport system carrier protein [Klebsiella pneumoniae]